MRPRLVLAAVLLAASLEHAAAWRVEPVDVPGTPFELTQIGDAPHLAVAAGWYRVVVKDGAVKLEPASAPRQPPLPPDALPDGKIAVGNGDIARAWLAEPTNRYGHGVLGDATESQSVVVERRGGRRDIVRLGADAVFEDLEPRLVRLGGSEKVIVVRSYLAAGSALAVIGESDGRFRIVAETPPIGTPNRWLNPAGVADFDGDGAVEIALVRMPHALGRLELWRWSGGSLEKVAETRDTSNHAIGSRVLRMSVVEDFDGDGVADLAIPSFDRRAIRLLSFRGGVGEIARVSLPAPVTAALVRLPGGDGTTGILLGTGDGRLFRLRR